MKTKITFAILALLINVVIAGGKNSAATTSEDTLAMRTYSIVLPAVEEEAYINDIPFDTEAVALNSFFVNLVRPDEETYVNDIPFSTEKVFAAYNYFANTIQPEEEEYVDDIPFNTSEVIEEYIANGCNLAIKIEDGRCDD